MYYYLILLISLFALELFYFRIADKCNIIDKPNERSSHTRITLRGGGVIFYLGVLAYFVSNQFHYLWFFIGLTLITAISMADDIRSVSKRFRLLFQFSGMGLLLYQWSLSGVDWAWWYVIIALILCTGVINAYNFMDGINGITGGYSLVVLLSLAYLNASVVPFTDARLINAVITAVMVFNFFNFRKRAKCFAGDVGSVSIAFVLLFLIGQLILTTGDFSYIVSLAVYGADSVLTIIHRVLLHENISEPHRKHLYQLMANELGYSHVAVSSLYMLVQAVIFAGFIWIHSLGWGYAYLLGVLLLLSLFYLWFMKRYFHLHVNK